MESQHIVFILVQELEKVKNFDWEEWRKRYLKFNNNKKSRVQDFFRKPQGRVHRRHPQGQVPLQQAGDERGRGQVRPRGRDDRLAGVYGGPAAGLGGARAADRHPAD